MSGIRFIHAANLRLGAAISGLHDGPNWLKQLALRAIRQAAIELVGKAQSTNSHLLVLSGQLAHTPQDQAIAIHWLNEQFAPLRRNGVRLAYLSDDQSLTDELSEVFDIVVPSHQMLCVTRRSGAGVNLTLQAKDWQPSASELVIGSDLLRKSGTCDGLVCRIVRNRNLIPNSQQLSRHEISISAGTTQSLGSHEPVTGACQFVEADFNQKSITGHIHETDSLRFVRRQVELKSARTAEQLVDAVSAECEALAPTNNRTYLVDWIIKGDFQTTTSAITQWNRASLLQSIRDALHSGHRGVWPATLQITTPRLSLTDLTNGAVTEFINLLHREQESIEYQNSAALTDDLMTGLTTLTRAA